jgi:hypothetical protein
MGFWKALGNAVGDMAGAKMIQSGSDVMINRHTDFQALAVNSKLRAHADSILAQHFKNSMDAPLNEYEAALLKLGIYFANAEHAGDSHMQALLADSISKIRAAGDGKIRPGISLEVMGQTGA